MSRPVLLPAAIGPARPAAGAEVRLLRGETMGTVWTVRVATPPDSFNEASLRVDMETCLAEVCRQMSHWDPASELMRFNRGDAGSVHRVSAGFEAVLDCALDVARRSGGAYDPAAGHWVNLWGFGAQGRHDQPGFELPSMQAVEAVRQSASHGWADLHVERGCGRLSQPGGLTLDLGAVAKGHAVDVLSARLSERGFAHHLVDIGGELRGEGTKPDGQPWWVDLELPSVLATATPVVSPLLALHGLSVATSGDYRKGFRLDDGRLVAHTIDPRTGLPVMHGAASVTVLHRECMWADAWSTALLVLGVQDGLDLADRIGLPAFYVQRHGDELVPYASAAFEAMLT